MGYFQIFKKYWKILLMGSIAVFNGIIGFLSFFEITISYSILIFANFCLGIIYPIVEVIDRINQTNEIITAQIPIKTQEEINIIKEDVGIVKTEILEDKKKVEEKKKENRILVDLINYNVISTKTLDNNILDKKFISVICYQAGFSVRTGIISSKVADKIRKIIQLKREKKHIKEDIDINREYSKIFYEMGFIRLAEHNQFFIIPQDNIYPEELRDLDNISDYLIKQGTIIVSEEWEKIKSVHKKHDIDFYNNKMRDKSNPVNLNFLIMRINRRDMRHRFILRNDFNKEFSSELSTIVKLSKFKTLPSEKIEIKNLISQSSLKILILSLTEKEREKILSLEEIFTKPQNEGGLGIKHFYDYHTKGIENIKNILRKKFKSKNKINKYADLIYNNSKDYKDDLIKLGIEI